MNIKPYHNNAKKHPDKQLKQIANSLKEFGWRQPIRLVERAIKKSSIENDVILESFNGSGSTMMACEQLGRRCFAIELDPIYVDVAIKRWEDYTGQKAKL